MKNEEKFYENIILAWFLLFVYPPLGILLLWKVGHFDLLTRSLISLFFGLLFLELHHLYSSFIRVLILSVIIIFLFYRYHKLQEHVKKGKNLFEYALNHLKIREIIINYLTKYEPPTKNFNDLLSFEIYLQNKYPIIHQNLNLTHLEETYINIIYQKSNFIIDDESSKQDETKNQHYENELIQISKLIAPILKLQGEKFSLYFTLALIKQLSIEYYSELFQQKYGALFNGFELANVKEAIYQYSILPSLNTEKNSLDLAMFTYFLMHHNAFTNQDFYQNLEYVFKELQNQTKIQQEKIFQKHLFISKDELLKEIEEIEIISEMKTKDRFEIFVLELLQKLDYKNVQRPINKFLDYIVFINNHQLGLNIIYQQDESILSQKHLNHLVAGLKYHQIDKGMIITNSTFTEETKNLANKQNIIIWDKNILKQKALTVKRYQNLREAPIHEVKFSDLSFIPFEKITFKEIDIMTKGEFKYYIAELFKRNDYTIKKILNTNEGLDLIIEKNSLIFGVYTNNDIITENNLKMFITSCNYHKIDKMIAISSKNFTKEAIILAESCDIEIFSRNNLFEKIKKALSAFSYSFGQTSIS